MRHHSLGTPRLATLLLLHIAGAGWASPAQTVTRPSVIEWLPRDNQTVYQLEPAVFRNLELNTTALSDTPVFITVSPCTKDVHWTVYRGNAGCSDGQLSPIKEYNGPEMRVFTSPMSAGERYVLQLSSLEGGAAAVSIRAEKAKPVRMRLRVRSRRRLAANWDPSPIDPQATFYCVVASHMRNYTSLCAAQFDLKSNRLENKSNRIDDSDRLRQYSRYDRNESGESLTEIDNKIDVGSDFLSGYDVNDRRVFRKRKFSRSTRVNEEDPVIACVGDRTHHLIENLDPSATYFVSVFGLGRDRRAGMLLASGSVRPRTSVAKRLRENLPFKTDMRGRMVFYYKATVLTGDGLWLAVSTCGGSVDVEVLVRGKRLYLAKNIDPHQNFFVRSPILTSSIQETSDEGSIQFDSSSSEEARMRYVIKITPSRKERSGLISLELTASTSRYGVAVPELASEDGTRVRELRPRRSCRSVDIAFLPATHHSTDIIRYCVTVREMNHEAGHHPCQAPKKVSKTVCVNHSQRMQAKVIIEKVSGLKPGRKYAIQVTAASGNGVSVPYKILYVDTNVSCRTEGSLRYQGSQSDSRITIESLES